MGKLKLKVAPGSKQIQVKKYGNSLKVRLKAKPEKNKANKELVALLSGMLNIPKRDIFIIKGEKSRNKILEIKGYEEPEIKKILLKRRENGF